MHRIKTITLSHPLNRYYKWSQVLSCFLCQMDSQAITKCQQQRKRGSRAPSEPSEGLLHIEECPLDSLTLEQLSKGLWIQLSTGLIGQSVVVYLDDVTIFSNKREEYVFHLKHIFERCRKYGISLNPKKCVFIVTEGKLLGHVISKKGISIDPERIKVI